jgi:ATP-dependent helicase HepA
VAELAERAPGSELGGFVTTDSHPGIGRLTSIEHGFAIVRYFKGPQPNPYVDVSVPVKDLRPASLAANTRVFFLRGESWRVGRVVSTPDDTDTQVIVATAGSIGERVSVNEIEVRWRKPVDNPFGFLEARALDHPSVADDRSSIVAGWRKQLSASSGIEGLFLSSVDLYAHQVSAVRTVSNAATKRYLLADEVGLGKTIEACALVWNYVIRNPEGPVLILVPNHLQSQWEAELVSRFRVPLNDGFVCVCSYEDVSSWAAIRPGLLVVDEAHRITRTGSLPVVTSAAIREISEGCDEVLLLSATPVRSNEAGYLDLLSILDPQNYRPEDLDAFTQRVASRDQLALVHRALRSVEDGFEFSYLANQLRSLYPEDGYLTKLVDAATSSSDPELVVHTDRIRSHLSERYRLHHRMIRSRRSNSQRSLSVRGRTRGRPFTLETESDTSELRTALLEFIRSRLAAAIEEGTLPPETAAKYFRECASRCGSLPIVCLPFTEGIWPWSTDASAETIFSKDDSESLLALVRDYLQAQPAALQSVADSLSALLMHKPDGKAVVVSSFSEPISQVYEAMRNKWGAHRVALHVSSSAELDNQENLQRWRSDETCSALFCDAGAEEGTNLQSATSLIHLDLPWEVLRLEQRIGRCDRIAATLSEPIKSIVIVHGYEPFAGAWFEFLADGANVFNRSISTLQYVISDSELATIEMLVTAGPAAVSASLDDIASDLQREAQTIEAHDELDSVDHSIEIEDVLDADNDGAFTGALKRWFRRAGLQVHQESLGIVSYDWKGKSEHSLDLEIPLMRSRRTKLALSRESSVARSLELLRAGHPLVDAIAVDLHEGDSGIASASFRHAPGVWPPLLVGRASGVVAVSRAALTSSILDDEDEFADILSICAAAVPIEHFGVCFLGNGSVVDRADLSRPFSEESGDIDLNSKNVLLASLLDAVDWSGFCRAGPEIVRSIIAARCAADGDRNDRVKRVLAAVQGKVQKATESPNARLSVDLERLAVSLNSPRVSIMSAGAIFVGDRTRAMS